MRKYIRHPIDIPIEFDVDKPKAEDEGHLNDVSAGGISFYTRKKVAVGEFVTIRIPPVDPTFNVCGQVVWSRKMRNGYNVGVAFSDDERAFQAKMIEQVCYIEHYKKEVLQKEGRHLSLEEASQEWIEKYADEFSREE